MKPKYNIGDKVKFFKDADSLAGAIISFGFDPQLGEFRYTFSVKVFDPEKNDMIDGVKICLESELVKPGTEPVLDKIVEPKKENE